MKDKETEVVLDEVIRNMISSLPSTLVGIKYQAKILYMYYESLVEEGFTKDQALLLIVQRGIKI